MPQRCFFYVIQIFNATTCPSLFQACSDGTPDFPGPLLAEQEKKKGRNKRTQKGGEKPASRYKKRKKDGEEKQLMHPGSDAVMTQIKQVRLFGASHLMFIL